MGVVLFICEKSSFADVIAGCGQRPVGWWEDQINHIAERWEDHWVGGVGEPYHTIGYFQTGEQRPFL